MDRVATDAAAAGHSKFYLWCTTLEQFSYYSKRGWKLVEVVDTYILGKRLKVMSRRTGLSAYSKGT